MKAKKSDIVRFKKLMAFGKQLGKKAGYQSEKEVAEYFTNQRRKTEPWRKKYR